MQFVDYSCKETNLIEMLACGDESAFKILYDQHEGRIYRLAMRYLKSTEIAEEVVQDVFMKLWQQRKLIRTGGPIEAWLFTVGKNNVFNRLKKQANEWKALNNLKIIHANEDDSLQEKLREADYQLLLKGALDSLSEKQLLVYNMARKENLSYVQIAEHLAISPLTVKTHMARALGQIRTVISPKQLFS